MTDSHPAYAALIVICGPTATGKSGLALAIAQRFQTVILSADSRQVYREFDIGTAKPSTIEQKAIPHFLIDICNPTETLTLADYQGQAQALIAQCHATDLATNPESHDGIDNSSQPLLEQHPITPLLVGGTGLYIRSVVRGLKIPRVPPHPQLRSQLESLGQPHNYAMLRHLDPTAAQKIHPNDPIRTLRALEVYYVTGRPISQQQGETPPPYPILQIGLDCETPAHLQQRIAQRTNHMVDVGFVDEVATLCQKYGLDLPLLNTLGYREMRRYLTGDLSLAKAIDETVIHTRQFAKRQRTWFRPDTSIEWFDADCPALVDQVWQRIQDFMARCRRP